MGFIQCDKAASLIVNPVALPISIIIALSLGLDTSESGTLANLQNQSVLLPTSKGKSCGAVYLSSGKELVLYENGALTKDEYESVHEGKLVDAHFSVRNASSCLLEICGFGRGLRAGGCDSNKASASNSRNRLDEYNSIYDDDFSVSAMSCSCHDDDSSNCEETCNDEVPKMSWSGYTCAIMYREKNCTACYFAPVPLQAGAIFESRHSFAMKSLLVRDGCTVNMKTNGYLYMEDKPYTRRFEKTTPSFDLPFNKDPENFTCQCNESVLIEMRNSLTSKPMLPSTSTDTTINGSDVGDSSSRMGTPEYLYVSASVVASILLLIVLSGALIKFWKKRKGTQDVIKVPPNKQEVVIHNGKFHTEGYGENKGFSYGETFNQSKTQEEILVELKKYVEYLMEFSKQQEIHLPQSPSADDASSLTEQFDLVCQPEFNIPRESFSVGDLLGSGHFGNVYKALLRRKGDGLLEPAAVKTLKPNNQDKNLTSFLREISIFQHVGSHENVVTFIGASCHNGELFILTKFCDTGSLKQYLVQVMQPLIIAKRQVPVVDVLTPPDSRTDDSYMYSEQFEEAEGDVDEKTALEPKQLHQLLQWSEQIANGMEYLASKKIIHVDLAARNILLTRDLAVKLCDFGLSRKYEKDYVQSLVSGEFPVNSIAPECIAMNHQDPKGRRISVFIDIWAYGCTMWEMFNLGKSPYAGLNLLGIAQMLGRGERLEKPKLAPDFVYDKILECWDEEPHNRPSFTELRNTFTAMKNEILLN